MMMCLHLRALAKKVDARNTVTHRVFNACRLRSVITHSHP
jgi:hypothetical protein